MSGICVKMNGAKCAEEYCDYWNREEQICTDALIAKLRVELLKTLLKKKTTPKKELEKALKDMNLALVPGNKTKS
jgi:hypothetical protein